MYFMCYSYDYFMLFGFRNHIQDVRVSVYESARACHNVGKKSLWRSLGLKLRDRSDNRLGGHAVEG